MSNKIKEYVDWVGPWGLTFRVVLVFVFLLASVSIVTSQETTKECISQDEVIEEVIRVNKEIGINAEYKGDWGLGFLRSLLFENKEEGTQKWFFYSVDYNECVSMQVSPHWRDYDDGIEIMQDIADEVSKDIGV